MSVTVTFSEDEARAILFAAEAFAQVFEEIAEESALERQPAILTGANKLKVEMFCLGVEE